MSRCCQQLTLADRRRLHHLVEREVPINEMARQLGRHRSTIYREIKRNTFHDRELSDYAGYYSTVADDISKDRRRRLRKLRRHPNLRTEINQVEARWSPEHLLNLTRHINDQPCKCLGYRTPTEVFMAHLHEDR